MESQLDRGDRLFEIQSAIGKALWQIQACEDTLAHLITMVLKLPPRVSLMEAQAILDDVRSKTLGRLIEATKKAVTFDESFDVFMSKFLKERNWLVHRSWRTHADFLQDAQAFIDLRYRIQRLSSDANEFNHFFVGIIESWVRKHGVSDAEIEAMAKEFTDVWRKA